MISLKSSEWQIDNIETVLFDKDGTLIDLHYFWGRMTEMRAKAIMQRFEIAPDNFEKICFFLGYDVSFGKMLKDGITALYSRSRIIDIFRTNLEEISVFVSVDDLENIFDSVSIDFYKDMTKYIKPIEGAYDFIKELVKQGVKLGIVTSDSVESTLITLKFLGWDNLFGVVIGRESSEYTKESGKPTELALSNLGANPNTTIMIGDAPMDFVSAKNAGVENVILLPTGQLEKKDFNLPEAKFVNSLKEITLF